MGVYRHPFSGKLSCVMTNSDDQLCDSRPEAIEVWQLPAGAAATAPTLAPPIAAVTGPAPAAPAREVGGRGGPDPTRYGDWELRGRCIDF
jgi:hypothetical protein